MFLNNKNQKPLRLPIQNQNKAPGAFLTYCLCVSHHTNKHSEINFATTTQPLDRISDLKIKKHNFNFNKNTHKGMIRTY